MAAKKTKTKKKKVPAKRDPLDIAEERGWTFEWKEEPGDWNEYLGEGDSIDDIEEVLYVVLKDKNGHVLESLGGITFAKGASIRESQGYGRSIERDLATEAIYTQEHGR